MKAIMQSVQKVAKSKLCKYTLKASFDYFNCEVDPTSHTRAKWRYRITKGAVEYGTNTFSVAEI